MEVYQLQESSLHETAEMLGISIAATKARMFHARAALRRAKELQFIGPSITKIFVFKSPRALQAIRVFFRWRRNDEATVFSRLVSDPASTPSVAHLRGHSLRPVADPLGPCC